MMEKVCLQDVKLITINTLKHQWKSARDVSFIYLTTPHVNLKGNVRLRQEQLATYNRKLA
jgi:hypothetical protein